MLTRTRGPAQRRGSHNCYQLGVTSQTGINRDQLVGNGGGLPLEAGGEKKLVLSSKQISWGGRTSTKFKQSYNSYSYRVL